MTGVCMERDIWKPETQKDAGLRNSDKAETKQVQLKSRGAETAGDHQRL